MQTSFEKHFGELKPDQIWDFSSYNLNRLGLESGFNSSALTRAAYNGVGDTGPIGSEYAMTYQRYYQVPSELNTWIDKYLREEIYNKKKGTTNFTLKMPEDRDVVIIPIYQGQAGLDYNLCIKSEDLTFPEGYIWQKSAGIQYKDDFGQWKNLNGRGFDDHTVGRDVQANPVRLVSGKVTGSFSLYLDILNLGSPWDGQSGRPFSATFSDQKHASSLDGQMVAISLDNYPETFNAVSEALRKAFADPSNPTDGKYTFKNFMLIGCEDSNLKRSVELDTGKPRFVGTDWDMNDLIFLVVGITMKDIVYVKDEVISKRYMVEDLGSDFDYDFNDIVFDITQKKHTDEQGVTTTTQTLSLKHLCGTIPWRIKVGDWTSDILPGCNDHTNPKGYDPETGTDDMPASTYASVINITLPNNPWDPEKNNIIMTAWPKAAGLDNWTNEDKENFLKEVDGTSYEFPKPGEYPFIIACDQSVMWNDEHVTVEKDAIKTWKRAGYETIETPGSSGGGSDGDGTPTEDVLQDDGYDSVNLPLPEPDEDGNVILDNLDITFDNWTDDIIIEPEYLQNIKPGYKIITYFDKINASEQHLMYMSVKAPWANLTDYNLTADQNTLVVNVTPDNIGILQTYGIALTGINVKVTGIEIIADDYDGVIITWDNLYDIAIDNYSPNLLLLPGDLKNVKNGGEITVSGTATNGHVKLAIPGDQWNGLGEQDVNGDFSFTVKIDGDQASKIKEGSLAVQGSNITFKQITYVAADPILKEIVLERWGQEVNFQCRDWGYNVHLNSDLLADVEVGDKITVYVKDVNMWGATMYIQEKSGWTNVLEANQMGMAWGSVSLSITEANINTIKNNGLAVMGTGYTITTITCTTPTYYDLLAYSDDINQGTVTVNPAGTRFEEGTQVTLTVNSKPGYKFLKWSDENTENPRTVTVSEDLTLRAYFEEVEVAKYSVSIKKGENSSQGTLKVNGAVVNEYTASEVPEGTEITVEVSAESGYTYTWSGTGVPSNGKVTVNGNVDITVDFTESQENKLWEGTRSLAGGGNLVVFTNALVNQMSANQTIRFYCENQAGWIQIFGGNWGKVDEKEMQGLNWDSANKCYYAVLSSAWVEVFKREGIGAQGENGTINMITVE